MNECVNFTANSFWRELNTNSKWSKREKKQQNQEEISAHYTKHQPINQRNMLCCAKNNDLSISVCVMRLFIVCADVIFSYFFIFGRNFSWFWSKTSQHSSKCHVCTFFFFFFFFFAMEVWNYVWFFSVDFPTFNQTFDVQIPNGISLLLFLCKHMWTTVGMDHFNYYIIGFNYFFLHLFFVICWFFSRFLNWVCCFCVHYIFTGKLCSRENKFIAWIP